MYVSRIAVTAPKTKTKNVEQITNPMFVELLWQLQLFQIATATLEENSPAPTEVTACI